MKKAVLAGIFVMLLAGFAQASVIYGFSGTYIDNTSGDLIGPVSFTLTLPTPIPNTGTTGFTPDDTYTPGGQLVCDVCDHVSFYYDGVSRGFTATPSNVVGYGVTDGEYVFYFDPSSFTTDGVYTDVIGLWFPNQGTLTVSGASTVPEPSGLLLLGTGVLSLAGAVRRKLML